MRIMKKENYNYIISNIILSKNTFSYNEILDEIKYKFNNDEYAIDVLNKALIRLREDMFITILGNSYTVLNCSI